MRVEGDAAGHEEALGIVRAWNEAWMAQDLERMESIVSDDFIQWHVNIRKEFDKKAEFDMLREAVKVLKTKFEDIRLTPMNDGAVLQQCLATVAIEGAGTAERVPFAMVYKTRGGKLVRCDEYMDGMSLPRMDFKPAD